MRQLGVDVSVLAKLALEVSSINCRATATSVGLGEEHCHSLPYAGTNAIADWFAGVGLESSKKLLSILFVGPIEGGIDCHVECETISLQRAD